MKLFLDCEFTNFNGDLISMALVSENGDEFYEVVQYKTDQCHPWVVQNVLPILNKDFIFYEDFQINLRKFLNKFDEIEVIADWPEDFWHFTRALLTGPGNMITCPKLTMTLERRIKHALTANPHNALCDAHAIREGYLKQYTP